MGRTSRFLPKAKHLAIGRIHSGRLEFNGGAPRGAVCRLSAGSAGSMKPERVRESFVDKAGQQASFRPLGGESAGDGAELQVWRPRFSTNPGPDWGKFPCRRERGKRHAPVPALGRERNFASWCHPSSGRLAAGYAPLTCVPAGGARPVSSPAPPLSLLRGRPGTLPAWASSLCPAVPDTPARLGGSSLYAFYPQKSRSGRGGFPASGAAGGRGDTASDGEEARLGFMHLAPVQVAPGQTHESAARRWPRWWPWGRSAGRTAGR